ncbi:hypothetical protein HPB49_025161 [Dermacentor silvarum]|uniref:Uncharacterized protein n=1 Tax=Dermacentor silvarum TaxID=543639 RepID=A0ACB8DRT4_DERSI|nr:hypothetical protein HPB49_025161 [Dermacentor silvarum]
MVQVSYHPILVIFSLSDSCDSFPAEPINAVRNPASCQAIPQVPGATTCPRPGSIVNGVVDVPSGTLGVNARIRYRCDTGYTLVGVGERVCQSDGSWSDSEPVCQAVPPAPPTTTCAAPAPIANGAVDVPQGTLSVNSRVQYRCRIGYTLVGTVERICQSDGSWSGAEPVCQVAVVTTCPTPGSITNGVVDVPPGLLGVNTKVQYRCNVGYMLIGMTERVCQMDGSWSGVEPRCQAIPGATCPAPGPIANGAVDFPPGMLGVNTRVQYRCNPGYTLVGMMERVCQADGSWSNAEPVCQDAHPPAGDDKASDSSSSSEAQTTSWVLLSLLGVLVVAGAVVLYMAFQFYRKQRRARAASVSSSTRTQ